MLGSVRGAPRRDEAGEERDDHEQQGGRREREADPLRADVEQQPPQEPRQRRGSGEPDYETCYDRRQALPCDEPEHIARVRPERDADRDLARPVRHLKRHDAVDADCRQGQPPWRTPRARASSASAGDRTRDRILHRAHVRDRLLRIDATHGIPQRDERVRIVVTACLDEQRAPTGGCLIERRIHLGLGDIGERGLPQVGDHPDDSRRPCAPS